MEPSDRETTSRLPQLASDYGAVVVTRAISSEEKSSAEGRLQLDSEAHKRWKVSISVEFLNSVRRILIRKTRERDHVVCYELEVYRSGMSMQRLEFNSDAKESARSTSAFEAQLSLADEGSTVEAAQVYTVLRSFSDFEHMRKKVIDAVSVLPQCTCSYCVEFVLYTRYKLSQPRSVIKLTTGVVKRKDILTTFMQDLVAMGKRRVQKSGKRKCQAQEVVPGILEDFLTL